ncbi:hypothetical protein Cgig2_034002 [Carnegiea gigantea]|uniref:BZIP domain-containing protein n=1 Tax=Carnegiea gigantea TaxID=171969 RepID=A0A9Q1Q914_9CARY|nr:hypothetical protein Cgig2_034002 [Carnegiea gigantea]
MELELSDEHGVNMMEEIDWEHMFDDVQFPEDVFDFVDAIPPAPDVAGESWIGEIEQLLMKDDDYDESHNQNSDVVDGFTLSDILLDSPEQERQPSPEIIEKNSPCPSNSNSNSDSDLEANVNVDGNANLTDNNHNNTSPNFDFKADDAAEDLNDSKEDDTDDDPLSKKRKRQLRNRDAAMRSRERKKMYVKDLEVKSRYLEAECRRLGRLLQCCYAENQMLRISLQSGSTFAMAKPESAVLLLESLLLGSLVWFMALMCLLPVPRPTLPNQGAVALGSTNRKDLGSAAQRRKGTKPSELWLSLSFVRSKRCRASRTKMKPTLDCLMAII